MASHTKKTLKKRKKQLTKAVKKTTGILSGAISAIKKAQQRRKKLLNSI